MTHQFYCHYTGKDGITPRRRLQQLTFFDHVPAIGNSTSSPTPLWVEVFRRSFNGHSYDVYLIHAQLSSNVAVYIEHTEQTYSCKVLNEYANGILKSPTLCRACADTLAQLRQFADFTTFLLSNPSYITPSVLAAYQEARPAEYQKLLPLYPY